MKLTKIRSLSLAAALITTASLAFSSPPYWVAAGDTEWQPYFKIWAETPVPSPQRGSWTINSMSVPPGDTNWQPYYNIATGQRSSATTAHSEVYKLTDGSTVQVFADGKMGMQDRYGNVHSMQPGELMVTQDGKHIIMVGNETARVYSLLRDGNTGP